MDVFNRQVDMGPETALRKQFMEHLCAFYLETSKPLTTMPAIGKNPLDLFKVYATVKEKGGFQQVCGAPSYDRPNLTSDLNILREALESIKEGGLVKQMREGMELQVLYERNSAEF